MEYLAIKRITINLELKGLTDHQGIVERRAFYDQLEIDCFVTGDNQ